MQRHAATETFATADCLAHEDPAGASILRQARADDFDAVNHHLGQIVDPPGRRRPVGRTRCRLPGDNGPQLASRIEEQDAIQVGQVRFQAQHGRGIGGGGAGRIGEESTQGRIVRQGGELIQPGIEEGIEPVGRRRHLGIETLAGQAMQQLIGETVVEQAKRQHRCHDHQHGKQRVTADEAEPTQHRRSPGQSAAARQVPLRLSWLGAREHALDYTGLRPRK